MLSFLCFQTPDGPFYIMLNQLSTLLTCNCPVFYKMMTGEINHSSRYLSHINLDADNDMFLFLFFKVYGVFIVKKVTEDEKYRDDEDIYFHAAVKRFIK